MGKNIGSDRRPGEERKDWGGSSNQKTVDHCQQTAPGGVMKKGKN